MTMGSEGLLYGMCTTPSMECNKLNYNFTFTLKEHLSSYNYIDRYKDLHFIVPHYLEVVDRTQYCNPSYVAKSF